MASRIRAGISGIALLAIGLTLGACGGSQDAEVGSVAEDFYQSVDQDDGAAACALLTPAARSELEQSSGKQCEVAILEEVSDLPGNDTVVEVFDTMAQVRWGDHAAFLTRMEDGWRLTALACTPRPVGPFDCKITGG